MNKGDFIPKRLTCKKCLQDIDTSKESWYVLLERAPFKADIKGHYHVRCYSNLNCENCKEFRENLVCEGGMCDLLGIDIRHSAILFCEKHVKIEGD